MQLPKIRLIGFFCLGLGACQAPETSTLLQENSATSLIEISSALSPQELAFNRKIASRNLLQDVIDHAPKEQVQSRSFACSAQSGGVVAYLRKAEELCGLRFSLFQETQGCCTRWYYQDQQLALVVHELSEWQGKEERIEQTVFYWDGAQLLQVLQRVITAPSNRLEAFLETRPFERIKKINSQLLWEELQAQEQQLLATEATAHPPTIFCP